MPNPNAVVSTFIQIEAQADRPDGGALPPDGAWVTLGGDRRAFLNPNDERAQGYLEILEGLRALGMPVYLELAEDRELPSITRLLIPLVSRVVAVAPEEREKALRVELELSHARHLLRRDSEDFALFERRLRDAAKDRATLVVTEDEEHQIIDVREFEPGPDDGPRPPLPGRDEPLRVPHRPGESISLLGRLRKLWRLTFWPWWWCWWPWQRGRCVSLQRAEQAFAAMAATSCNPVTVPPPCIPFLYPDDGCWGRAHEMCRLMIAQGLSPRKVWISGSLHTPTKNNPSCFVGWNWHVAPTLCVCGPPWSVRDVVIDPSLFTQPVSKATWKGVQGDPNATLTDTDWTDFQWGATDPTFVQTNQVLATYRLQLKNRSIGPAGPPPYANCP